MRLKPKAEWRPGLTWERLVEELNAKMQFPGWTNAYTMPIKGRVDMLSTGVRTPVGVKVMGTSLGEIEKIGLELERLLRPIRGTRSVFYERNTGGLYLDIIPDRDAMARYGLTVGDLNRVVEAAIGGAPIGITVDGRNRFSINVRYPQDLRSDVEQLRRLLVPVAERRQEGRHGRHHRLAARPRCRGCCWRRTWTRWGRRRRPAAAARISGRHRHRHRRPERAAGARAAPAAARRRGAFVPLGQVAEVRIAGGPPMIRDDGGLLVGFVYVDIDTAARDVGGYVDEAKAGGAAGPGGRPAAPCRPATCSSGPASTSSWRRWRSGCGW